MPGPHEPRRKREREVQPDDQTGRAVGAQLHEVIHHLLTGASVAQGDQDTVDDVGHEDARCGPLGRSRPVNGDDLHAKAQPPASSQSLVTVFQFLVVVTTPNRRSKRAPLSLELPYPSGVCT